MKLQQLILLCVIFIVQQGSSQDPCDELVSVGVAGGPITVSVDGSPSAVPVPVCIRCGYSVGFLFTPVTDPSLVTYVDNTNGQNITMNTTDIIITNNGLLLPDPASSFEDGESITCNFNDGTMSRSHVITIDIFIFNPPPITPVGDILDYIEGDTVILTCTGDSQINSDLYQWTLPDGILVPGNPAVADSGLDLTLTNISRTQSGVYICTGSLTADTVESNVTLNIQYPVTIISFTPDNSTVTVGSILTLNCTFDGNPAPNVLWSQNSTMLEVQNNLNVVETITNTYALLEITFADITVSGGYACGVNNTIGIDQTDFTFFTVQVAPGPVATLENDSSTDTCISLSWTYGFNGNAPITGVDIAYEAIDNNATAHSGSTTSDQTAITICNLQPFTIYEFTVTVNNSVSSTVGASSPLTVSAQTDPLVPNEPTIDSVTPVSSTALTVTWTPSINTFTQTPILAFQISYNIEGSDTVTTVNVTDPSATSKTITDLQKGMTYEVRIVSGNSAGPSPPSDVMEQRTNIDPPSDVNSLVPTANPFSICVAWNEPSDNGGQAIEEYKIERWDINEYPTMENFIFVTTVESAILSYTIENLENDTEYSIRVTASNAANGEGDFGEPAMVNASTGQALIVDDDFVVTLSNVSAISVMVAWTVPANDNNIEYRLQIVQEEDDFNPDLYINFTSGVRSGEVKGLNPNSTYYIRMTRIEGGGCVRQVSETMDFETLEFEINVESSSATVVAGSEIVLECLLSTGQAAPNVVWSREDGDIPANAIIMGHTLTIPNPSVDDSGDYVCTSNAGMNEQDTFSVSLLVQPPPSTSTMQTTPTTTPTVLESADAFPVWAIGAVAAGAFICILLFVVVLIVFIYCCCCRSKEEKGKARYDLAKPAGKKAATGNMWLDEGASGFSSIPQYNGDDTEAPVGRGRTMTNDYVSATSFNTLDKKGSSERLTDLHEGKQTDV